MNYKFLSQRDLLAKNKLFVFLGLKEQICKVCQEEYLVCGEGDEQGGPWMEKVKTVYVYFHKQIL